MLRAVLHVPGGTVTLRGDPGACVFGRGRPPVEVAAGARVDDVLA
jgi:hypothetical protein